MAVYVQPYNPWKEQAALSLLGGFIDKLQQTEQNRKTNAFRGQLQQNLAAQTGGNDNISLMPQNVPQGYNDNPWASAFHKTDNPLTQFNIGTAGSMARLPTMSEIANMGASLGASKRFSGLNPDTVQKIIAEMAQANEMQRMNDLRSQYAQRLGQAGSWDDWFKILTQGNIEGVTSADALKHGSEYSQSRQLPKIGGIYNAGGHGQTYSFDPITGKFNPQQTFAHTPNPDTALENKTKIDVANIAAGPQYAQAEAVRLKAQLDSLDDNIKAQREALQAAETEFASREYESDELRAADYTRFIEPRKKAIKDMEAQRDALIWGVAGLGGGGGQSSQNSTAGNISTVQPIADNSNPNSVWFAMIGSPKGAYLSAPFGQTRTNPTTGKAYKHGGIDIPMKGGTDIIARPELGDTFTIDEVGPNGGYGNTVLFKSNKTIGGETVRFRVAHLQDGSFKHLKRGQTIRAGDIIGKVGNTGRVRGKNGGYHLHLEVLIGDGNKLRKVNPSNFFSTYAWDTPKVTPMGNNDNHTPQAQSPQATSSNIENNSNPDELPVDLGDNPDDDSPVILRNKDGGFLTQSNVKNMALKYGMTLEDAIAVAKLKGYSDAGNMNYSYMNSGYWAGMPKQPGNLSTISGNASVDKTPKNTSEQNSGNSTPSIEERNGSRNSVFGANMNYGSAPTVPLDFKPEHNIAVQENMPVSADISDAQSINFTPYSPRDVSSVQPMHSLQMQGDLTIDDMVNYFRDLGANLDNWMMPATSNPAGFDSAFGRSLSDLAKYIQSLSKNKSIPIELQTANEFRDLQNFYGEPTAPAYPNNFNDKNRRNSAYVPTGSPYQTLTPWNLGDFIQYLQPFFKNFGYVERNGSSNFIPPYILHNLQNGILNM